MRVRGWQVKPGHLVQVELAACYRVFASRGWPEAIFKHLQLRVPGALWCAKKFGSGPANQVVRACLLGLCRPLVGVALFAEYEDVIVVLDKAAQLGVPT